MIFQVPSLMLKQKEPWVILSGDSFLTKHSRRLKLALHSRCYTWKEPTQHFVGKVKECNESLSNPQRIKDRPKACKRWKFLEGMPGYL